MYTVAGEVAGRPCSNHNLRRWIGGHPPKAHNFFLVLSDGGSSPEVGPLLSFFLWE